MRRWKLIALTALTVTVATLVLLFTLTPKYTATAEVLLEPRKQSMFGADSVLPELSLETGTVDSQISVITSFNLVQRVVEKYKLEKDEEFGTPDRPGLLESIMAAIGIAKKAEPPETPEGSIPSGRGAR